MNLKDLEYSYPDKLIATEPSDHSRVMICGATGEPIEIDIEKLMDEFQFGDVLVLNDSKVVKKRLFASPSSSPQKNLEVLFVEPKSSTKWEVLFPSSRLKKGDKLLFAEGVEAELVESGRPQIIELNKEISFSYFENFGELPLPPYIQKARGDRHQKTEDNQWYQTAWANKLGSSASPTASLHFKQRHLDTLSKKGVKICYLTLHIGLGTFLPIQVEDLSEHQMHREWIEIPEETLDTLESCRANAKKVWALGTTVCRSLESLANSKLSRQENGSYVGASDLFIYPGYEFQYVDRLMTNFHQPKTSLLALVSAFAGLENVKRNYQWAIDNNFRLFSYGDLSVWKRK